MIVRHAECRPAGTVVFGAVIALALGADLTASASPAGAVPFGDRAPRYDREHDVISVAASGWPTRASEPARAALLSATARAESRALALLHAYVDDALAAAGTGPRQATAVHQVIDRSAVRVGLRPLVDRAVVVVMQVPAVHIRAVAGLNKASPSLPWMR